MIYGYGYGNGNGYVMNIVMLRIERICGREKSSSHLAIDKNPRANDIGLAWLYLAPCVIVLLALIHLYLPMQTHAIRLAG